MVEHEAGRRARSLYVQIDALVCGDAPQTKPTFELIATGSGGKASQLTDAAALASEIIEDVRSRLAGAGFESGQSQTAVAEGRSLKDVAADHNVVGQAARRMHKLLAARGADVAPSGDARTGWVKVSPGTGARFTVHVYLSRWKFADNLAGLMGLTDYADMKVDLANTAKRMVEGFLGMQAGDASTAGIDKSRQTAAERGKGVPVLSKGVLRGEKAVVRHNKGYKAKIDRLLEYWTDEGKWEHDYIWVPVDLLP